MYGRTVLRFGANSWNHKSDLVIVDGKLNARRYVDEVLRPHMAPLVRMYNLRFQHDNTRAHTARVSQDFLNNQNIVILPWPARSPDMSPFELVWKILRRNVRSSHQVRIRQHMITAKRREWNAMPQNVIRTTIRSKRRR